MEFGKTEFLLSLGEHHARDMLLSNVAQLVFGIHVVIAGIHAAIVLQRYTLAAELVIDAYLRVHPHPLRDRSLEQVDVNFAIIAPVPVVPNLAEEVAPVIGIDRPIGDDRIGTAWMRSRRILHRQCMKVPSLGRGILEDPRLYARNELQLPRAKLTAQEAIDIQRPF